MTTIQLHSALCFKWGAVAFFVMFSVELILSFLVSIQPRKDWLVLWLSGPFCKRLQKQIHISLLAACATGFIAGTQSFSAGIVIAISAIVGFVAVLSN